MPDIARRFTPAELEAMPDGARLSHSHCGEVYLYTKAGGRWISTCRDESTADDSPAGLLVIEEPAPSLNEVLGDLGLRTEPAGHGAKGIYRGAELLFTGRAGEVWAWLREAGMLVGRGA